MADEQDEVRQEKLQEEDRRRKRVTADIRMRQQERQAQDEARQVRELPAEQQYAQFPTHSHTGIR
ncbi:hypothetical protein ACFU5O_27725 [Streptomyces sp. NPDC057445]|uniref:hypothetical protein n=1 Tax=Streptomyces sp. NPDC057445 TaxID=3346136 RepID=UPI0036C3AD96